MKLLSYMFIVVATVSTAVFSSSSGNQFDQNFISSLPSEVKLRHDNDGSFEVYYEDDLIYRSNLPWVLHDALIGGLNSSLLLHEKKGNGSRLISVDLEGFANGSGVYVFDFSEEGGADGKTIYKILDVSNSGKTCSLLVAWKKPVDENENVSLVYYAKEIWDLEQKQLIRRVSTYRRF